MLSLLWAAALLLTGAAFAAPPDFNKCMEISTFGYTYDALYKLKERNGTLRIEWFVKAKSDAHVLLSSTATNILADSFNLHQGSSRLGQSAEVLIGGGRNTFSEIRVGMKPASRVFTSSRAHVLTPDVLSPDEYRGFWVEESPPGSLSVGRAGNDTPFMVGETGPSFKPQFFGLSTWHNVKGHWRINCPEERTTEIESGEETTAVGMEKLRRDLTMFYDEEVAPEPLDVSETLLVTMAMHLHTFIADEHTSTITVSGKMMLNWFDWKLQWKKEDYDNITSFLTSPANIWTPPLMVTPSGYNLIDATSASVRVSSSGNVTWSPLFEFTSVCELQIVDWPKDLHACQVFIWFTHDIYEDVLTTRVTLTDAPATHWESNAMTSEWDLRFKHYNFAEGNSSYLSTMFIFTRKNFSFTAIFAAPFLAVALMTLAALWLKPDNSSKLQISCACSLVLTLFIVVIADKIPTTSVNVPTIVSMYMWGLLLSTGSVVHFVLSKNLRACTWTLPYWSRRLLTNPLLDTCLCLNATSLDPSIYSSLQGDAGATTAKDWVLVTTALERFFFLVYFIGFATLSFQFLRHTQPHATTMDQVLHLLPAEFS